MIHQHPCLACGWRFPCTCNDPEQHDDLCFECAAKAPSEPVGALSPQTRPESRPADETWLWASWERLPGDGGQP